MYVYNNFRIRFYGSIFFFSSNHQIFSWTYLILILGLL